MKCKMTKIVAAMALTMTAGGAHAAIIDQDWQTAGDANVLLDTTTGLRWLDLSVTADVSHNRVVANLGAGGLYEGFRLATQAEVLTLWSNAGVINTERDWVTYQYSPVRDVVMRLGPTVMEEAGLFPFATHTLGMVEGGLSLAANQRWAMELTFAPDGLSTRTSASHYVWDVRVRDMHYSTYLVAVPETSTYGMMLAGLGLMGLTMRLRK